MHRSKSLSVLLLSVAAVSFAPPAWAACQPDSTFSFPATGYVVGPNPHDAAIADFDGDGIPDVAVVNSGSTGSLANTVSVRMGLGNGLFGVEHHFPTQGRPYGIVAADLNGDGILDLAVSAILDNEVDIFLGNGSGGVGDGTFAPYVAFPAGTSPYRIAVGDYNHDGRPDLVALNNTYSAPGLTVLLAQGAAGSFTATQFISLSNAPAGLVSADFNEDGILDLAATVYDGGYLAVMLGQGSGGLGDGSFGPPSYIATTAGAFDIQAADLNDDSILDLVTCGNGGGVDVHLGLGSDGVGNGTFGSAQPIGGGNLSDIEIADFDGDGKLDITASGGPRNAVYTFSGHGDGTFGAPAAHAVGNFCIGLAQGDLDGDGHPDLVSVAYQGSEIRTLLTGCPPPPPPPNPHLDRVRDVSNDQGGKVFVLWQASSLDGLIGTSVNAYRVWRRVPYLAPSMLSGAAALDGRESRAGFAPLATARALMRTESGTVTYWEALVTLPAQQLPAYGYTAATTQDSLPGSNPFTAFFVTALTADPNTFYNSNVDSGYSVDNLPPSQPNGAQISYTAQGAQLQWTANVEADLECYRVYRGVSADFVPDASNLLGAVTGPNYLDSGGGSGMVYKIDAVDKHENASPYATVGTAGAVGVQPHLVFALAGPWPNPSHSGLFNVSVTHPYAGRVTFEVFDVRGTRVFSRRLEGTKPGIDTFTAGANRALGAGLYFVRVTNGPETREVKTIVLP
jgi:VCBS repeat protein